MLVVGGIRVIDGAMTIGQFVSFTQYLAVMVLPLMITGWFFANLPRSAAAATRIDNLFTTDPEIAAARQPAVHELAPMLDPTYVSALNANRLIRECMTGIAMRKKGLTEPHYLSPLTKRHGN